MNAKDIEKYKKKSLKHLKSIAQTTFNKWVRNRDLNISGNICISCGKNNGSQAGHYYSRGSHPALALDEDNVFLQCTYCNLHQHGNLILMRQGILKKIGEHKLRLLDERASYYKRNGWKPDRLYYISKIIQYK